MEADTTKPFFHSRFRPVALKVLMYHCYMYDYKLRFNDQGNDIVVMSNRFQKERERERNRERGAFQHLIQQAHQTALL